MTIELTNQWVNAVRLNRASKLTVLAPFGMSVLELSVPERVERRRHDEQDREQGEDAGSQRHQVAPAHASEPRSDRSSVDLLEGRRAAEADDRDRGHDQEDEDRHRGREPVLGATGREGELVDQADQDVGVTARGLSGGNGPPFVVRAMMLKLLKLNANELMSSGATDTSSSGKTTARNAW